MYPASKRGKRSNNIKCPMFQWPAVKMEDLCGQGETLPSHWGTKDSPPPLNPVTLCWAEDPSLDQSTRHGSRAPGLTVATNPTLPPHQPPPPRSGSHSETEGPPDMRRGIWGLLTKAFILLWERGGQKKIMELQMIRLITRHFLKRKDKKDR